MLQTDVDVGVVLRASLAAVPDLLLGYCWALLAFFVAAAVIFSVAAGGVGKISLRVLFGRIFPGALHRQSSARVDRVNFLLQVGLWQPLLSLMGTVVVGVSVRDLLIQGLGNREPVLHGVAAIVAVQVGLFVLIGDFASYFQHWCLHKIPVLWSFHRCHHSAEALTLLTERRGHPIDLLWGLIVGGGVAGAGTGLALYWLGTPLNPGATAVLTGFYGTVFPFMGLLQHSHVWISFGKLDYIFTSPTMHQLHHSAEVRHRDRNLGGVLMIYDWLFGTLYVPARREDYRWGLNDEALGERNPHRTLRGFYVEPFVYMWRVVRGGRRGRDGFLWNDKV